MATANYLVDSILRVMAKLVAKLATLDGELIDLSTVHTRFRNYIARELGPPNNRISLVASAFNASETSIYAWRRDALRTRPHRKTDRDWLLEFIQGQGARPMRYDKLEGHFLKMATSTTTVDELAESTVTSIRSRFETALWLLRKADLVFATSSDDPLFFAPEMPTALESHARLLWLEIFERSSPTAISRQELQVLAVVDTEELDDCLDYLLSERRIERMNSGDPKNPCYRATELYLPIEPNSEDNSLEVAVLDHLRVVVDTILDRFEDRSVTTGQASQALCQEREQMQKDFEAKSGLISWRFELWPGHPMEQEILSLGERLVEIGHRLSLETRITEGERTAERVIYVGAHTKPAQRAVSGEMDEV